MFAGGTHYRGPDRTASTIIAAGRPAGITQMRRYGSRACSPRTRRIAARFACGHAGGAGLPSQWCRHRCRAPGCRSGSWGRRPR